MLPDQPASSFLDKSHQKVCFQFHTGAAAMKIGLTQQQRWRRQLDTEMLSTINTLYMKSVCFYFFPWNPIWDHPKNSKLIFPVYNLSWYLHYLHFCLLKWFIRCNCKNVCRIHIICGWLYCPKNTKSCPPWKRVSNFPLKCRKQTWSYHTTKWLWGWTANH